MVVIEVLLCRSLRILFIYLFVYLYWESNSRLHALRQALCHWAISVSLGMLLNKFCMPETLHITLLIMLSEWTLMLWVCKAIQWLPCYHCRFLLSFLWPVLAVPHPLEGKEKTLETNLSSSPESAAWARMDWPSYMECDSTAGPRVNPFPHSCDFFFLNSWITWFRHLRKPYDLDQLLKMRKQNNETTNASNLKIPYK